MTAVLEGAQAGTVIRGLSFQCLDEAGRLAKEGTLGKVQVSWSRGTKKVKLQSQPLPLPNIQAGPLHPAETSIWCKTRRFAKL